MNDNNTCSPALPREYVAMTSLSRRCSAHAQCKLRELLKDGCGVEPEMKKVEECFINGNWNELVCDRLARSFQKEVFPEVALQYAEKYVEIRKTINEIVFKHKKDEYYDTLALIYGDLGRYKEELDYRKRGMSSLTDEEIDLLFDYDVKKRIQFLEAYIKADQGDAEAQFQLAEIYYNDRDLEKEDEAIELYIKAAEQGHLKAQHALGDIYKNGYDVERDYRKAAYWYTKAAEQGCAESQTAIGWLYAEGLGVKQDFEKAMQYWQEAETQGDANAIYYLGCMYYKGHGVQQNLDKSMQLCKKAVERGNDRAKCAVIMLYHDQGMPQEGLKYIEQQLSPENRTMPAFMFAVGTILQDLGRYEDALREFERYLDEVEKGGNETNIALAKKKVEEVKEQLELSMNFE